MGVSQSKLLRKWREGKGLTQRVLAEQLGVHPQYVSDIERGKRRPGMDVAVREALQRRAWRRMPSPEDWLDQEFYRWLEAISAAERAELPNGSPQAEQTTDRSRGSC